MEFHERFLLLRLTTPEWSLRLHTNSTVETDYFAVHHRIQNDRFYHHRVLVGFSKALRKRHRLGQMRLNLFRQRFQERSFEQTGRNGANTNSLYGQTNAHLVWSVVRFKIRNK